MKTESQKNLSHWLALHFTPGMSWQRLQEGQSAKPNWLEVDRHLKWAEEAGNEIISIEDSRYPPLLKEIHDPPLVLFVKGSPDILQANQLAVVGSRKPTPSGRETAYDFAKTLSQLNLVITSGLAHGIDAASHRGALANNGHTIAVLGTGLDIIYPHAHKALAEQIMENGAIISEFALGTPPLRSHFPQRNRIVTGMSVGTLVVEAALKSGSLISARYAMEQNREVFAIPGSIHNPYSAGCHQLIKNGAKLVSDIDDILSELNLSTPESNTQSVIEPVNDRLDEAHNNLIQCVGFETTTLDVILSRNKAEISETLPLLLNLELEGLINSVPGGYVRVKA